MLDKAVRYLLEFWRYAGDEITAWLAVILVLIVILFLTRGYGSSLGICRKRLRRLVQRLQVLSRRREGKVRPKDIRDASSRCAMVRRLLEAYVYDHSFDVKVKDALSSVTSADKMLRSFMIAKEIKQASVKTLLKNVSRALSDAQKQL